MMSTLPRVATGRGVMAAALAALLIGTSLAETGCAKRRARREARRDSRVAGTRSQPVVLDGRLNEWPENVATLADADYLYFRLTLEEVGALQAAPEPITLMIDLDASAATGVTLSSPYAAQGKGFDLGVQFSPQDGRGGVAAFQLDPTGAHVPVPASQLGIQFAPTHAATDFEVRIARWSDAAPGALASALAAAGPGATMITLQDAGGKTVGFSDPESFTKPAGAGQPARSDAEVPSKPAGTVRVVTWNVHRSGPMTNSGPFARVFQVLEPDAILVQEWDDADAATLAAWFTAVVSGEKPWSAHTAPAGGVAIVAPHPISPLGPESLTADGGEGGPVRSVAAVVQTPLGDLALASLHLKCCGGPGGQEDAQRMAEALTINAAMREALIQSATPLRVIGGDINLVGLRSPLDVLRAGLDSDSSDLEIAQAFVLGDRTLATWADPSTQFTPGRLDYALFGEGSATLVSAFVLDTSCLSDAALARLGLDRADTEASDHRPLVIDLRPR